MNTPNVSKYKRAASVGGRGGKQMRTERTTDPPYDIEEYFRMDLNNLDAERFRRSRTRVYQGALVVALRDRLTADSRLAA